MLSNIPLLALAFIAYNAIMLGFLGGELFWESEVFSISMLSGAEWSMELKDLMVLFGLLLLFFEVLKATRIGTNSIVDHLLSTIVLVAFIVEFLLVKGAATGTFFVLMVMSLFDVMAGFSVSIRSATRDVSFGDGGF